MATNNKSEQEIWNAVYDSTNGWLSTVAATGTVTGSRPAQQKSEQMIMNSVYDDAGALRVIFV